MDESQCYFCASVHDCDLCTHTHYNLCAQCRNSDPTQGWWGESPQQINLTTNGVNDDGSFGDDVVFHTAGSAVQDSLTGMEVLEMLMLNGSRTKPAKRTRRKKVSINNPTALWKDESLAIQHHAEAERKKDYRQRHKKKNFLLLHMIFPCRK